jgi:hypothetical protein
MKNILIVALLFSTFVISCDKGASKISLDDVEAHRSYQDTILVNSKTGIEFQNSLDMLINEYKSLEKKSTIENANLDYYLSRLYSSVFENPLYYTFVDSVTYRLNNIERYTNLKDSARYYAFRSLKKNPNHIRSFYLLTNGLYWEWMTFINSKNKAPFIGVKSPNEFAENLTYISKNAFKFYDLDTSKTKILSQKIIEYSYFFINAGMLNFNYSNVDYNNKSNLEAFMLLENYCKVLDNAEQFYTLNRKSYLDNRNSVRNLIQNAKFKYNEIIKKEEEESELARNTITINHDGSKDWDLDATMRKLGEEVWTACKNYPNAINLIVNVTDKCKDTYGNETLITSTFNISQNEMIEFRKYQDAASFNANCFEWGIKLLNEYKPCGRSQLPN